MPGSEASTPLATGEGGARRVSPCCKAASTLQLMAWHHKNDLLFALLSHLRWRDVLAVGQVSRFLRDGAADDMVWERHCAEEWADKVFVPAAALRLRDSGRFRAAFSFAMADSKRTHITVDELPGTNWYGRMKASAGEHYTETDAWWQGKPPMRTRYLREGVVVRPAPAQQATSDKPGTVVGRWRFVRTCAGRRGPMGSFVRVYHSHLGRETPSKVMFRHSNWGWIMDSCWHIATSWPLPPRHGPDADPSLDDESLQMTVDVQRDEAMAFNHGIPLPDGDDDSGAEAEGVAADVVAATGREGNRLPEGGAGNDASARVAVEVNGVAVQLPIRFVLDLLRQNQLDGSSSSSTSTSSSNSDDDDQDDDDDEEKEDDEKEDEESSGESSGMC